MKQQCFRIALAASLTCGGSYAAQQTWTGEISSSMCSSTHGGMGHDCIMNCIKAGEKYIFTNKKGTHPIQNQDFSDLEKHAGHTVKLTGDLGSDGKTITVTKVEMAAGARK
jgi:hypothetical protein